MPKVEHGQIVETATEARAGTRGQKVSYVLAISTGTVIVLFAVVYILFFT